MSDAGPHASLLAAEFPPTLPRFLDSHASLHQKSLDTVSYELTSAPRGLFLPQNRIVPYSNSRSGGGTRGGCRNPSEKTPHIGIARPDGLRYDPLFLTFILRPFHSPDCLGRTSMPKFARLLLGSLLLALFSISHSLTQSSPAAETTAYQTALGSIVAQEMFQTVERLASPKFEGREAGSTGGRAAGDYLVAKFQKLPLIPAGERQGYFQPFGYNYRNILALLPGSDPALRTRRSSSAPITTTSATAALAKTRRGRFIPALTTTPAAPPAFLRWPAPFPACRSHPVDRSSLSASTEKRRAFWARSTGPPNRPCRSAASSSCSIST